MNLRPLVLLILLQTTILSYTYAGDEEVVFIPKKIYLSNSFDGTLLSFGSDAGIFPLNNGIPTTVGTPRFTYFFNIGTHVNYDVNSTFGLFTGIGIKNLGFIEKITPLDSTVKRRVYSLGAPLGLRIGNIKKKTYGFVGGGVDMPFNYKEKGYVKRGNKDKFNEWFSDRVQPFMPYAFAGISFKPGVALKIQYYPNNFMNPVFTQTTVVNGVSTTSAPYAKYDIRLFMVAFSVDIRYTNKLKIKKKESKETMM